MIVDWKEYKYITESKCKVDRELYDRIVKGEIPLNDILQLKVLCYLAKIKEQTKKRKQQLELFKSKAYCQELSDNSHWIWIHPSDKTNGNSFILEDIDDEKLEKYVELVR